MSISSEKTSASGRGNVHDRLNTKDQLHLECIASFLSPRRREKQHRREGGEGQEQRPVSLTALPESCAVEGSGLGGSLAISSHPGISPLSFPFLCGQESTGSSVTHDTTSTLEQTSFFLSRQLITMSPLHIAGLPLVLFISQSKVPLTLPH